ncbi:MAG TPA: M23 family metallopeptidase [Clostridiales bacterium]|nr:M23 family metallopeptidase [Clostridiales bacterium]
MDNKSKGIFKKLKSSRAVYITAVTLLVALAVIIAITVAANRAKKKTSETETDEITSYTDSETTTQIPEVTDKVTDPPVTTEMPPIDTSPDTNVADAGDEVITLALPCSGTLTAYHDESLQVWSITMRDYRVHLGVDIATEANAPVYAAADGVVAQVWEDVKMGYCIAVKHGEDTYTIYRNLGETPAEGIAEGVTVRAGQLIAFVGESAMIEIAQGPHLHLEMTMGGVQVNPLDYFDQTAIASLTVDTVYEG